MKNIKFLFKTVFIALAILLVGCEEENYEFGDLITPTNVVLNAEIVGASAEFPYGDGSGVVNFTASADDVITYKYVYDGAEKMAPDGVKSYSFGDVGVNKYAVTVIAIGVGGVGSSTTVEVEVLATYVPPADLLEMLTGGSSRTWRVKAEAAGHFGVGPVDGDDPVWWAAAPYDKEGLGAYDDRMTFNIDGTINYETNGDMYGQAGPMAEDLNGDQGLEPNDNGEYENYPYDDFTDNWSLSAPGGEETLTFSTIGHHGFYVGGDHSYVILERSENEMSIRTVGKDGNGWFGILTAESNETDPDPEYTNLIWQDEFDTDGVPSDANWNYDIGTGSNGWGNGEDQYYTDRADNVSVSDGVLKITAKKESYEGSDYTSARLLTQDKFEFTYGRVDVRAKLASGGGTWPAIWMLGANFNDVGWPACGEVDIMEYVGNNPGTVSSAIHNTSSSGATENYKSTSVENETTEFHLYSIIWSEDQITFLVDDVKFYTYRPETKDQATWPFDADQFLILNVAMGGTLGGTIDPDFTESVMEIDYVRVYQ